MKASTFWTRRTSPKAPFPITFSGSKSSAPSFARFSLSESFLTFELGGGTYLTKFNFLKFFAQFHMLWSSDMRYSPF